MLILCLSETMHACRIRLSAAVLQGRDGSGLDGTLSSSAWLFAIHSSLFLGKKLQHGMQHGFDSIHTQEEDVVLQDWQPVLILCEIAASGA